MLVAEAQEESLEFVFFFLQKASPPPLIMKDYFWQQLIYSKPEENNTNSLTWPITLRWFICSIRFKRCIYIWIIQAEGKQTEQLKRLLTKKLKRIKSILPESKETKMLKTVNFLKFFIKEGKNTARPTQEKGNSF